MNLLYHFRTRGSGAEGVHIAGIAEAWERQEHRVRFVSPGNADPRLTKGANPFRSGKVSLAHRLAAACPGFLFEFLELSYNIVAAAKLWRALRREPADLLYERHAFFLVAGAWVARRLGVPLVVEVNELVGDERVRAQPLLAGVARRCDAFVFRQARQIIVVSPHLARRVIAAGAPPERVRVLPNAVDPALYPLAEPVAAARARAAQRTAWGIAEDAFLIGFAGWFVPWHRLDGLVIAMSELRKAVPEARLILFGDGPGRSDLERQAAAAGIADALVFPGAVPHASLPAQLAACDALVVPHSNVFRSPIKLFEYLAVGRPVVAPATEPIAAVVADGGQALLFPPQDWSALATCLQRLADDPALGARLAAAGRERVLAHHTWDANAQAVLSRLQ